MRLIQRQILFERLKDESTIFYFMRVMLLDLKSKERVMIWIAIASGGMSVLLYSLNAVPQTTFLFAEVFLAILFLYMLFRQSESYRSPYYRSLGIQNMALHTRRRLADLERVRDSLKSKGLYQREDIDALIEQVTDSLDLKYNSGIWQHSLFLLVISLLTSTLVQSLSRLSAIPPETTFGLSLLALIFVTTVVPQIYDISTGERQLLKSLLKTLKIIRGDLRNSAAS